MKKQQHEKTNGQEPLNAENDQQAAPASDFKQTNNNDGWTEHKDGEVVKLEPGQSIEGELISKKTSSKYNGCGIYKIMVDDDPLPKVILGSKQLDMKMESIDINTQVKIFFEGTQATDKGQSMKVFRVFTKGKTP